MVRPRKLEDDPALDLAIEVFWKSGPDDVSIRDLEAALGLRAPSIYRRFGNKDGLLARSIDRYVEQEVGGRIRYFLAGDDPLSGLRRFFTSVLRPHPDEERPRGCLLTLTTGHASAAAPGLQLAIDRGFALIEEAFRDQIEQASALGQIAPELDAAALAKALLLSFQGLLVLARSGAAGLGGNIEATFGALLPVASLPVAPSPETALPDLCSPGCD